ncbi:hypothetical protein EP331_04995 [bacterium]|nr:MAG: hypothetical protein EP331_04995 [bacterium]
MRKWERILSLSICLFFVLGGLDVEAQTGSIKGEIELASANQPVRRTPSMARYGRSSSSSESNQTKKIPVVIWVEQKGFQYDKKSEPQVLDQVDQSFQPSLIVIRQNDVVRVLNSDPLYHNVFSLSKVKSFDVGRRPKGEYLDVKFDKYGTVDVFCDIHSSMTAVIKVLPKETVQWVQLEESGVFEIPSLADGTYQFHAYAPGYQTFDSELVIKNGSTVQLTKIELQR